MHVQACHRQRIIHQCLHQRLRWDPERAAGRAMGGVAVDRRRALVSGKPAGIHSHEQPPRHLARSEPAGQVSEQVERVRHDRRARAQQPFRQLDVRRGRAVGDRADRDARVQRGPHFVARRAIRAAAESGDDLEDLRRGVRLDGVADALRVVDQAQITGEVVPQRRFVDHVQRRAVCGGECAQVERMRPGFERSPGLVHGGAGLLRCGHDSLLHENSGRRHRERAGRETRGLALDPA